MVTHSEDEEEGSSPVEPARSESSGLPKPGSSEPARPESSTQPVPRPDGTSEEVPQLDEAEREVQRSQDPAVRAAVSTYATEQIFTTLNVEQRVKEALPPRAAFLASPLTGAVHGYVQDAVSKVIASPQFAQLWPQINRVAHQQVMSILYNDSAVVRNSGDKVTLNPEVLT